MIGTVLLHGIGRPELVYGRPCKADQLEHEVWITEAELLLGARFQRNAPVGRTTADALLLKNGTRFYIEVDNETMTARQMREKWIRYGNVNGYILVICHKKSRMRRLVRSAERIKRMALFSRFRWLQSTRVREPWVDCYGKRTEI